MNYRQSEKSVKMGKLNRDRIILELLKQPSTFTMLKNTVGLSGKTLSQHLGHLRAEDLVKREIRGKYIFYVVAKPQTVLDMRKSFLTELKALAAVYWHCLNKETLLLFEKTCKALQESTVHPEPDADTDKIVSKTIPIPAGFKGTVTQSDNLYKMPEYTEAKGEFKIRKRHSYLAKKRRMRDSEN